MVNFEDVKDTLKSTDLKTIYEDYTNRQQKSIEANDKKAKDVLAYFPDEIITLPKGLDNIGKLNALLMLYLNSWDQRSIRILFSVLKKYGYKNNNELFRAIQMTDLFFQKDLQNDEFERTIYGLTMTKSIKSINSKCVQINSILGNVNLKPLYETIGYGIKDSQERLGLCHDLTSCVLENNKDFYGAYYYLPLGFTGEIEHSVILDLKSHLVFDFANNIIVPFLIWRNFFGEPEFILSGNDYQLLSKQTKNELNVDLNICLLEQVRRRKK